MKDCPGISAVLKLALITAISPQLPNTWAASPPCDSSDVRAALRELTAPESSGSAARLASVRKNLHEFIRTEKLGRDWNWSEPFSRSQEKILDHINSLTLDERNILVRELDNIKELKPTQATALRLALHHEPTWRELISSSLENGIPSLAFMASPGFRTSIEKMPEAMKGKLLRYIGQVYPKASSWNFPTSPLVAARANGGQNSMVAPKRALDAMIRLLYRGDQRLVRQIKSGTSPLDAYRRYLSELKSDVFPKVPVGGYSADDVLDIARKAQSRLESDEKVFMYGSFPNGTARKGSDIDLGIWVPSNRRYSDRLLAVFDEMKRTDAPRLSSREYRTEGSRNRMGRFNPVMIEITTNEIKLLTYSPEIRKLENFDYVAPPPSVFLLE